MYTSFHSRDDVPPTQIPANSSAGLTPVSSRPPPQRKIHYDSLPPSQLTPSCSRCRLKKLKCQFEDRSSHAACTNCLVKGLGHACHRDLRTPRGKKGPPKAAGTQVNERSSEIAALKRRLSQLEGDSSSSNQVFARRSTSTSSKVSGHLAGSGLEMSARGQAHLNMAPAQKRQQRQSKDGVAREEDEIDELAHSSGSPPPSAAQVKISGTSRDRNAHPESDTESSDDQPLSARPHQRRRLDEKKSSSLEEDATLQADIDSRTSEEQDAASTLKALATTTEATSKQMSAILCDEPVRATRSDSAGPFPEDRTIAHWSTPQEASTRVQLIRDAKTCIHASDEEIVHELLKCFCVRVNHNVGHVMYEPGLRRAFDIFLSQDVNELSEGSLLNDPAGLAVIMLVLCLGWDFHPDRPPRKEPPTPSFRAVQSLRQKGEDPTKKWYKIARAALAVEHSYKFSSIAAMQAACLVLARGRGSPAWLRMIQLIAINSAQDFGLHRLGHALCHPDLSVAAFIRLETGVRIWNYLVLRDWCAVGLCGEGNLAYLINPNLCTTRRPLNLSDDDLERGISASQPMDTWTPLSFCIAQLELADIVREGMDLCRAEERHSLFNGRRTFAGEPTNSVAPDDMSPRSIEAMQHLIGQYINGLPPHFALDSRSSEPPVVIMLRWQLHQQIFDLLLGLSRRSLASTILLSSDRTHDHMYNSTMLGSLVEPPGITCRRVARAIIAQHGLIRNLCPIVDGLMIHFTHLFSASLVTVIDLINRQLQKPTRFTQPPSQQERQQIRAELQHALEKLRESIPIRGRRSENDPAAAETASSPKAIKGRRNTDSVEAPVFDAQWRSTQVLQGLFAFEEEVARSPMPLHSINSVELDAQRRELSSMARRIVIEASSSASTAAAAAAHERRREIDNHYGKEKGAPQSTIVHWPAMLMPPEERRNIPQGTVLPIVRAWQPLTMPSLGSSKHTGCAPIELMSSLKPRKSSWPDVFPGTHGDDDKSYNKADGIGRNSTSRMETDEDKLAAPVVEWALAMRDRMRAYSPDLCTSADTAQSRMPESTQPVQRPWEARGSRRSSSTRPMQSSPPPTASSYRSDPSSRPGLTANDSASSTGMYRRSVGLPDTHPNQLSHVAVPPALQRMSPMQTRESGSLPSLPPLPRLSSSSSSSASSQGPPPINHPRQPSQQLQLPPLAHIYEGEGKDTYGQQQQQPERFKMPPRAASRTSSFDAWPMPSPSQHLSPPPLRGQLPHLNPPAHLQSHPSLPDGFTSSRPPALPPLQVVSSYPNGQHQP